MVRKLGLIAFANDGGLGAQTRRLAQILKPERIMVVDSSGFSPNTRQHYEWYKDFNYFVCNGFPTNSDVQKFLPNLTHVLTCENPYNFNLVWYGQKQGTKIYCQSNYEFCDNLDKPYLPVPDKFLMPSYWKLEEMQEQFGKKRVIYLPPLMDVDEFKKVRDINFKRKGKPRFLHIIGTVASLDRNGTLDLLDSIKFTKADFELVIKTQHSLTMEYFFDDPRIKYEIGNIENNLDLYRNFDALLLPRRWGGLSLTTNEALVSGLPVIMTNISPNDKLLPLEWLVESEYKGQFQTRSMIDYYSVNHKKMAKKIDWLVKQDLSFIKTKAFLLGNANFSKEVLLDKYLDLFN